jgi:hypothetical protein
MEKTKFMDVNYMIAMEPHMNIIPLMNIFLIILTGNNFDMSWHHFSIIILEKRFYHTAGNDKIADIPK